VVSDERILILLSEWIHPGFVSSSEGEKIAPRRNAMTNKISSLMLVLALGFGTATLVRAADSKDVKKDSVAAPAATAPEQGKKKHTRKHKSAKAATPATPATHAAPATPATPSK
jgi:hypothetical protein